MQSIILSKIQAITKYRIKQFYKRLRKEKYRFLSSNKICGDGYNICQPVLINGKGRISAGRDTTFGWESSPEFFSSYSYIEARTEEAFITIGERSIINNCCRIISDGAGITIGNDCLIGTHCEIIDSDFHSLNPSVVDRKNGDAIKIPVKIGNNVFIGNGVRILKGVSIGDNSVIANGCIVTNNIPNDTIAAGIPAKVIRSLIGGNC